MSEIKICRLAWQEARCSDLYERFTAASVFGNYEALEWSDGGFGGSFPALDRQSINTEFRASTIEEAKAFCQANYERRFLALAEGKEG